MFCQDRTRKKSSTRHIESRPWKCWGCSYECLSF